jgi:Peptidase family M23
MTNPPFIWPLGHASTPDEMNTSYGPRIDEDMWDFHDGIDLPAPIGTAVHAVADGVIHRAGPANRTGPGMGFRSTHIVLKVVDPADGEEDLFVVYIHLDRIATGVFQGVRVEQGDILGAVGREDATYPHLHIEFRKGAASEPNSRHPLRNLPYVNTANFTTPELDRCNFSGSGAALRTIRVRFDAPKRWEGDVQRVDVQLRRPDTSHEDKFVDFDNRNTIESSQGDDQSFNVDNVAVEGYQKSNLKGDNRIDLNYGVLVRNIAPDFTSARVQVTDTLGVHSVASEFALPTLAAGTSAINSDVSFENPTFPPPGWTVRVKTGNVCQRDSAAKIEGLHGLLCQDVGSPDGLVRAALRFALPANRSAMPPMSWRLGAKLRAAQVPAAQGTVVYPLAFLAGSDLVAAMCLRRIHSGKLVAGVLIRSEDGMFREKVNVVEGQVAATDEHGWELELLRIGTRETTAVLWLDSTVEVARINGDTAKVEPDRAYAGILHRHNNIAVTLHLDELLLTEAPRP